MQICYIMPMGRVLDRRARRDRDCASVASKGVLRQFSARLPIELLERPRIAAPQLHMTQSTITAEALHAFLAREGF